jgi:hypothetical protein
MLDLMDIKGKDYIFDDIDYTGIILMYEIEHCFSDYDNNKIWKKICSDYLSEISAVSMSNIKNAEKLFNKKRLKRLNQLLSAKYKNMIKMQLHNWIMENVNF